MSEAQTVKALPWSSLSLTDREIPWEDLRSVSDAAAESGELRRRLMADVNALLDRKYNGDETSYHDLEDLAVPAIFAMAADKLDAAGQREAAKFLIHFLYRAGQADDDFLLEVGERAAGRMGLAVLEPAMDLLQTHGSKLECWYHVFSLLAIATKANEEMRDRVRKFCRQVIREAPDRFERWSSIGPAAWTLAAIRDVDSLPFLRTIQQTAQSPELAYAIKSLECADGGPDYPPVWETPVEEWLASDVR